MAVEKRTASFWLPVQTITQIVRLSTALHVTQGQVIARAIEELARQEGLPVAETEPAPPRQATPRPKRARRIADPPGPITTKYNND